MWLMVENINHSIEFARQESRGNAFQRPLAALLDGIPRHAMATGTNEKANLVKQIDTAFEDLLAVHRVHGEALQFTEEGLALRQRKHLQIENVVAEWNAVRAAPRESSDPAAPRHQHLIEDVRGMITHSGDLSNLILDPDLDSYYLMDATLLALPESQDRLAKVIRTRAAAVEQGTVSQTESTRLAVMVVQLRDADLNRVRSSLQTALNEDANFYGKSATLEAAIVPKLKAYTASMGQFIDHTERLAKGAPEEITPDNYRAARHKARAAD